MTTATQGTLSAGDLMKLRNDWVRTGKFISLGRIRTIAIGPDSSFRAPANDPYINRRGRMMDLASQFLPIGQPDDKTQVLVTGTLRRADYAVGLPDLVDPEWHAPSLTQEEVMNPDCSSDCAKVWDLVPGKDAAGNPFPGKPHVHARLRGGKDTPILVPQRLRDRTSEKLAGSDFLVFKPVLSITYQPEDIKTGKGFMPEEWGIVFSPDFEGKHCTLLVSESTGECHFLFGIPKLVGNTLKANQV